MNDVPLIKTNSINDINTSLIAIKKQLKQINEAVGLIDIPSADTSGFVKLFNLLLTVGFILPYGGTVRPSEYWELCLGETKNRSNYPELISWAITNEQIGNGKLLGEGDGSTTFTLPDLREVALKGAGESSRTVGAHVKSGGLAVGEFIDDRLQNIIGSFRVDVEGLGCAMPKSETGVFQGTDEATLRAISGSETSLRGWYRMNYDASRVARTGSTNEVKAVGINYVIKVK